MLDWKEPTLPTSTRVVHWFIFKVLVLVGKAGFERRKTLDTSGCAHREDIWEGMFFTRQIRGVFTQNCDHTLQPKSKEIPAWCWVKDPTSDSKVTKQTAGHRPQNAEFLQVLGKSVPVRDLCEWEALCDLSPYQLPEMQPQRRCAARVIEQLHQVLVLSVFQDINQFLRWFKLIQPFWSP